MARDAEFSRPLKYLLTQRYMGENTLVISSASTMDDTYVQKMAKSKTREQKKIMRKSLKKLMKKLQWRQFQNVSRLQRDKHPYIEHFED
jgi:hypothetical protein